MAYLLCLVYVALTYIRPGEISPAMARLHLIQIAGVATAVATVLSLIFKPRRFADLPIDWCLLGFCLALLLSRPANGDLSNWSVTDILVPVVCSYFFIRAAVQTRRQLQILIVLVVLLTAFQAVNVIVQNATGTGLIGNVALQENAEGNTTKISRNVGVGMYGDPNDLAMMIVIVVPFVLTAVFSPVPGTLRRLIGLGTVAVLVYGVVLTQSRGGFLGLGALCGAFAYRRFGRNFAIVIAVVVLAAGMVYGSTRFQNITATDTSAQGRVQAWGEAIQLLKAKPVLGVGYGRFTELNGGLAAHNSFVHVIADSGLVGGVFFVGMFYWFMITNGRRRDVSGAATSSLAMANWASGVGIIVCASFLSRQYIPAFYVPLAIGAARVAVERTPETEGPVQRLWDWVLIVFVTAGVVVATHVAVRVFVRWGH